MRPVEKILLGPATNRPLPEISLVRSSSLEAELTAGTREERFDDAYRRYYRVVLAVAERRMDSFADAEDVTSEVFRITWQHQREGGEVDIAWLYATLRHIIGNEYRRSGRVAKLAERVGAAADPEGLVVIDPDLALDVARAMCELKPQDREVLELAYWVDLDGAELAQALRISRIAARSRLMRARRAIAAKLAGATPAMTMDPTAEAEV